MKVLQTRSALLTMSLLVAALCGGATFLIAEGRQAQVLDRSLILTRRAVETEVERFRYLPAVAAEDARIADALEQPESRSAIGEANAYLATIVERSGVAQLYLLNDRGIAIAASNYDRPGSFVANDYGFRPYFNQAMETGEGRFYAIGVTTGRPGYFLSQHLSRGGARGVIVAKVDLLPLQNAWRAADVATAIVDADGVVILSGRDDWLYRPLDTLSPAILSRISATQTFPGIDLARVKPILPTRLQMRELPVASDHWRVLSAASRFGAQALALGAAAIGALVAAAIILLGQTVLQRRQLVLMRLRQSDMLEARVAARTAELHEAQDALIHSEKMAALGRMSAAIVHEVSQPLAAMEATLAAAAIAEGSGPNADRIDKVRGHIRRILRTIKHLRGFGRKETAALSPVAVDNAVIEALDIVQARATGLDVSISFDPEGASPIVIAGQVRLEQVFVNLLLNALDAIEGLPKAEIRIGRTCGDGCAVYAISDTGRGIDPSDMASITEPFFTRRTTGEGLGLGLSITMTILESFDGKLRLDPGPAGGTIAIVTLPLVSAARVAA